LDEVVGKRVVVVEDENQPLLPVSEYTEDQLMATIDPPALGLYDFALQVITGSNSDIR
jgi:hypothetical protein